VKRAEGLEGFEDHEGEGTGVDVFFGGHGCSYG
jgi:hypothetical protein